MLKNLIEIFGTENVSTKEEDLLVYSYDSSNIKGSALAVVWPTTERQVKQLVLFANRTNQVLVPRGGGTNLVGSAVPFDGIVVDFSKMNRILKVDLKKKEAVVEPGVVIDDLNNLLKKYNLMFPVNPSSHYSCQIGGMIATNAVGNKAVKYGRTSDWVKELDIVDGTGKQISPKIPFDFIGTEGTVCFYTKITLKIIDLEEINSLDTYLFDNIKELLETIENLKTNKNLVLLEFFNKIAANLTGKKHKHHLIVGFLDETGRTTDKKVIQTILEKRDDTSSKLTSLGYSLKEDPKIPTNQLEKFLKWFQNNNIPVFGHIGVGILHPRFRPREKHLIDNLFKLVISSDAEISGEHGIGITKRKHVFESFKQKIRDMKKKYDPNDIMNSGKII